ncbi:MAG: LamG domain-containing protein [Planctomycetota bacterium]
MISLRTCLVAMFVLVMVLSYSMASAAVISHWRFEEGTADGVASGLVIEDSVGGYTADADGGTSLRYRSDVPSVTNGSASTLSLEFDGSNDSVTAPTDDVFGPASMTVEVFFKTDRIDKRQIIVSANGNGDWLLEIGSNGALDGLVSTRSGPLHVFGHDVIQADVWYFAAMTYDSAKGVCKIYLAEPGGDAMLYAIGKNTPDATLVWSSFKRVLIGHKLEGDVDSFDGHIDEVRFSSHVMNASEMLVAGISLPADLNEDGVVNMADFALFANGWLLCNMPDPNNCP